MNLSRFMPRLVASLVLTLLVGLVSGLPGTALAAGHASAQPVAALVGQRPAASDGPAVLTFKYDNKRSGSNPSETSLTTENVNVNQFGRQATFDVDGQIYAQPLYLPGLEIHGHARNVVFVATEHDSIYAFDADATSASRALLWHTSFLRRGVRVPSNGDVACNDLQPEIGITGTPVIDAATRTMYVVAFTSEGGHLVYRLHALDISTGRDRKGSPVTIQASVHGGGAGSHRGVITFDPKFERQRAGLLLANGRIYIAWGSFCDNMPYHGWILSYTYNGTAFHQVAVFNDTPDGARAGIWGAGGALAADDDGFLYYTSGNGSFNLNSGGRNTGDSVVKLAPGLHLIDYFTPFNQACLESADADLGSAAPLLLPGDNELITSGKEGRIYVIERNHMGHYRTIANVCSHQGRTDVDQVLQEFPPTTLGGLFSTPAYWNGPDGEYVYFASVGRHVVAYRLSHGRLSARPQSATPEGLPYPGANVVISSNGGAPGTGVLWLIDARSVLRAYDATDLGHELYNSNQNARRDSFTSHTKFSVPTVAGGKVFVPTAKALLVFSLLHEAPLQGQSAQSQSDRDPQGTQDTMSLHMTRPGPDATPGAAATHAGLGRGPGEARPGPIAAPVRSGRPGGPAETPTPSPTPVPTPTATLGEPEPTPSPTPTAAAPALGPAKAPAYNNTGVSDDSQPASANFDQSGNSYSAEALQKAGINPGDHVFAGGFVFVWPNALAGEPDNYIAAGQTLPLLRRPHARVLGLLGAADHGAAQGQLLITYSDGSSVKVQLTFSDWTLSKGKDRLAASNATAISLPYFNSPGGQVQTPCYVYDVAIPIPAGKTVKSVTLPAQVKGGRMHIFAVALK